MNTRLLGATLLLLAVLGLAAPPPTKAAVAESLDQPDTSIASNTVIDIVEHDGGIWMATGRGLNFSLDGGQTWLLYNASNGLNREDVSALYSGAGRLWVATAFDTVVGATAVPYSDTLMYTDNNGQNFYEVDLNAGGRSVPYAFSGQKVVYDISGTHALGSDWVFFTAWAGGFVGSRDGGQTWRRFHPSVADSIRFQRFYTIPNEPTLPNYLLYFSCVADNGHGDSLYVWAGTAGGVFQYVFAPLAEKPASDFISSIVYCDSCGSPDTTRVFLGGDDGITRATKTGRPFISTFVSDGLPGAFVTTQLVVDGRLFVGTKDSRDGNSTGLAVSDDGGLSYSDISIPEFTGANHDVSSMTMMGDRMYLAAQESGLFVSNDTGTTWSHLWVDSTDTSSANGRNIAWGLEALGDTLHIGTDSGLVRWYLDPAGAIDSSLYEVFVDDPTNSGARVIKIKSQVFNDTLGQFDSLAIWTVNRPVTANGTNVIKRGTKVTIGPIVDWAWNSYVRIPKTYDIAFFGDTTFAVGEAGIYHSLPVGNPSNDSTVGPIWPYTISDSTNSDRLDNDTITVMSVNGDTVFVGTTRGFAISNDRGVGWKIYRPNTDSLLPDIVIRHTDTSSIFQIPGQWIPAMGLQDRSSFAYPRVWLSSRPTASGQSTGIAVGTYEPVDTTANARYDLRWHTIDSGNFAWNFAFNGDTVFYAADSGLYMNIDGTPFANQLVSLEDIGGTPVVDPGTPVYAARVIGPYLWVGTDQATVRLRLDNMLADTTYYYVDFAAPPDEVYAYPVPYRQSSGTGVDFHFSVKQQAAVTLDIYDPAMNLVARLLDNRDLAPDVYQGRNSGIPSWDGRNGRGDQVAVGMYYFKVEYSTGEVRWGKLAVIP